jgi:hypothetical protein
LRVVAGIARRQPGILSYRSKILPRAERDDFQVGSHADGADPSSSDAGERQLPDTSVVWHEIAQKTLRYRDIDGLPGVQVLVDLVLGRVEAAATVILMA